MLPQVSGTLIITHFPLKLFYASLNFQRTVVPLHLTYASSSSKSLAKI